MNTTPSPTADPLRIVQRITLPSTGQVEPGPINTIVRDCSGNLYYSDEINHCVTSLDQVGGIRWQVARKGKAWGEFHYPRGLAVGRIDKNGSCIDCLAVADGWNGRVQFLDLVAGSPIDAWSQGSTDAFGEITDVRFIEGNLTLESASTRSSSWLVLDKGNHRLSAFATDGTILFQIGNGCPPTLETNWAIPRLFFEPDSNHPNLLKSPPPFDFLFYPERILGDSMTTLFLVEPLHGRLKQIVYPHLLPIGIDANIPLEWINAGKSGLLAWHKPSQRLLLFGDDCGIYREAVIHGNPVYSSLPPNEFWLQAEGRLERWNWHITDLESAKASPKGKYPTLVRTAARELAQMDSDMIEIALKSCLSVANAKLDLADEVLAMKGSTPDPQRIEAVLGRYQNLPMLLFKAQSALNTALHHWSLGTLVRHLAGCDISELEDQAAAAADIRRSVQSPIREKVAEIRDRLEQCLAFQPHLPDTLPVHSEAAEPFEKLISTVISDLKHLQHWFHYWSGIQ
jgi:hypothetical protein